VRRVVHLIPYDGIGGVERAAATAESVRYRDLVLERMFVFENVSNRSGRRATFDPRALWSAAGRLTRAEPALVILSLWRAVLVGGLARLRGCRAPMVLFLHNARDAHAMDRIVTRMAARWATAIWADSATTLEERLPHHINHHGRVISYLLDRAKPVRGAQPDPLPNLIFWGRLAVQKDPLRMLAQFARLYEKRSDATLTIIGPDGGLEEALRTDIERRGLEHAVTLTGPLSRSSITTLATQASFYIQTSRHEGMAISVIEAMQAGLVPVVTPVGEISRYTRDGENAVWIDPEGVDTQATARIEALLDAPDIWRMMRAEATRSFDDRPLYAEDVMAAAAATLDAYLIAQPKTDI